MKVSLPRTGNGTPEKNATSLVERARAAADLARSPKPMPKVSSSRPSNGALRVTPALTLKLIRLRSPGAPITRREHVDRTWTVLGWTPDHLVSHGVDAEVVPPHQRDTGAGGIGERQTRRCRSADRGRARCRTRSRACRCRAVRLRVVPWAMSPLAGWFSAYWISPMTSAPVRRLKLPPQRVLPRNWPSSLNGPPGGLS